MKANEVLYHHNLKRTSCREGIIEVMMSATQALSENEIRDMLPGQYDRSTFYRSFKTLQEFKILHKIVVDNQLVKYALDNSITQKKAHAHFYCSRCQAVLCLQSVAVQDIQLPDGYSGMETEIIVKGICAVCQNKSGTSLLVFSGGKLATNKK